MITIVLACVLLVNGVLDLLAQIAVNKLQKRVDRLEMSLGITDEME